MTITEAQSKRTRLMVWKDLLAFVGGTPRNTDTLYQTIRKLAVASGVSMACCLLRSELLMVKDILAALGGTPTRDDTMYSTSRKIAEALGAPIGCCNLPPIQTIPTEGSWHGGGQGGGGADVFVIGGEGGGILGGEGGKMIGAE